MKRSTVLWTAIVFILIGLVGLLYFEVYPAGGDLFGRSGQGICPWCGGSGQSSPGITSPGMMRGYRGPSYTPTETSVKPNSVDAAVEMARQYISDDSRLEIDEVFEFPDSYEAEIIEKKTHAHAFEILIYKDAGSIYFEMGPNMMWNTKYGMMRGGMGGMMGGRYRITPTTDMPISEAEAKTAVEDYIAKNNLGLKVDQAEIYYGFYEFHAEKDGRPFAQVNVNGYSGQVWYESWHGPILNVKVVAEE